MPRNQELAWGVVWRGERTWFDDAGLRGVEVAHRERPGGYDAEVRLPLAGLGLPAEAARRLGFALALNDADDAPADPGTYLSWNGGFDLYRLPSRFGSLDLPARSAPKASAPSSGLPLGWGLLLVVGAALAALGLSGPGTRFLAGIGVRTKAVALGATLLVALGAALVRTILVSSAREATEERLGRLAAQADGIAREAALAGTWQGRSTAARARALEALLSGERIPALLPPADAAFVALAGDAPAARHRVDLGEARTLWFESPLLASAVELEIQLPAAPAGRTGTPPPLGTAVFVGETEDEHPVGVDPGAGGRVVVGLSGPGPWRRLRWEPAAGAAGATLVSLRRKGAGPDAPVGLSEPTEDGVPIVGGPNGPSRAVSLAEGTSRTFALPYLKDADRLWLVLTADGAFPRRLGDAPGVDVTLTYDRGAPWTTTLRNGEHLLAEEIPAGIARPPDAGSRVAYRWRDAGGTMYAHGAVAFPLDPSRRAVLLEMENRGGVGTLRLVAATVLRSGTLPERAALGLEPGGVDGIDAVFVQAPPPGLAAALGPGGPESVKVETTVGPDEARTPLVLTAPLPPGVARTKAWTTGVLLVCLAAGLFFVVLLAADAVERLPRLSWRLAFAVLAAALLPLAATVWLVDLGTAERLRSEHAARARTEVVSLRAALQSGLSRAREAAGRLAAHLAREGEATEPGRVGRLVRLYRSGAAPSGTGGLVLVTSPSRPPLQVPADPPAPPLSGPGFLAQRSDQTGMHVSPWDGLLLVGSARSAAEDGWVGVSMAVRVDGAWLEAEAPSLGSPVALALLGADGTPLATAGDGGAAFARSLAAERSALERALLGRRDAVLDEVAAEDGRVRLAVLQPVATRADEGAWLAVGLDRGPLEAALTGQRVRLLWIALVGLLFVAAVAGLTARRVAEPVQQLVRVTDAVRRGEWDVEMPPARPDEVGNLTVAFDQMRRALEHRVGDLDLLKRAQDALSGSLDFGHRARTALSFFVEHGRPDAAVLLDVTSPGGAIAVAAEVGRRTAFTGRTFRAAPGGWLADALEAEGPRSFRAAPDDPRIASEGAVGERLLEGRPAWLTLALRAGAELAGLVVLAWDDPARVPEGEGLRLLVSLADVAALQLHNARLYRLAALDDVTRLPGATAFEAALRADVERAALGGPPVTLLRVGLDHVDHVTRRHGVAVAHDLLRALAAALRDACGGRSRLGRLGDDEFAVRLVGDGREEARLLAETVRERLRAVEHVPEEGGVAVASTATVGIARCPEDGASLEFLRDAAGRALAAARQEGGDRVEEATRLDQGLVDLPPFEEGAVFRSERMVRVVDAARRAARTDASVLITGETGTGKEVLAKLIHRRSVRSERPFVEVNCAAFPETLLESELFGHERGAFTGADRRREGRFELADGGTLFLDEIGEMAPTAQVRLLRVLQERQFTLLGGTRPVSVDVRILAATNQDLEAAVAQGTFREDLYYRLNVIRLEVPPLRERREEIPLLVEQFLEDARRRTGRGPKGLTAGAMDLLYRHPWPGNVRELKNVIERCAVLCEAEQAGPEHLRLDVGRSASDLPPRSAPRDGLNERQRLLLDHLARHGRCTNREYYEMSGTSPRTGLRDLQDLIGRGFLVREGKRRGAAYRLP
jgi:diguanylate cyclase (GGDEF)-like protein